MLRIALTHLRHVRSGGTERYLDLLAAHLADLGHAVEIVCRSHELAPHPAVRFVRLRPLALGASARLWSFARAVERHVARENYDVVYGLGRTWSQDLLRLGGGCQATYLERAHGATRSPLEQALGLGDRKQRTILAIERRALAREASWRVVVNSRGVRDDVIARFRLPPEQVEVIYNGVDVERFHPRLRESAGAALRRELAVGEGPLILFLGSGYGRKGLDSVLQAFARASRRDASLCVVGYDSDQPRFETLARSLGIFSRVRFLGGRDDAPTCFAAADVYALPTRYDPFANSTLEALACGLPVITTRANGGSELLNDACGSVLEDAESVDQLQAAIESWCDADRLETARGAARALAERHSHAFAMSQSADLIERCAARRSLPR